ncbi:hypothetical protein PssB301D_04268 [Pseudomonas syringae pv. syringae str. B301D-R]|nr:hypothetical protein PsyrB_17795 [Pseudomonas syringae pv. syringae B301D]EXL29472.1 hypothetical protein PssB301D_04268 [Pseudomonas syringae pv. syringae str. B301D-R]SOP97962.1 hypothetical protein CFBP2118_01777 [Pseudomonas syringae pv. syringae]
MATATRRHALPARLGAEMLFERDGTDDAECDVSDRAKEPDEVGPEAGAKGFAYFGPIKVGRRGTKRCPESNLNPPGKEKPPCDAERHELHSHAEREERYSSAIGPCL